MDERVPQRTHFRSDERGRGETAEDSRGSRGHDFKTMVPEGMDRSRSVPNLSFERSLEMLARLVSVECQGQTLHWTQSRRGTGEHKLQTATGKNACSQFREEKEKGQR